MKTAARAELEVNKPVPVSLNWLVLNLLHLYSSLIQDCDFGQFVGTLHLEYLLLSQHMPR